MVTEPCRNLSVFGAVADPTRRAILDLLRRGDLSAGEIADRFPVSRPAVSRHLRVLRNAGLLSQSRAAQSRRYALNPAPLRELDRWLNAYRVFWGAPARSQTLRRRAGAQAMTAAHDPWVHTFETTLPGDPGRVFAALTTAEALTRWFADHVEVELLEGGAFRFWGRHAYGTPNGADATQRVTRIEPPTVLAFTWRFDGVPTEVTLTATPAEPDKEGPRTTLALRHAFEARLNVSWSEELVDDLWRLTLGNLQAYLRGGDGIVLPDYTDPNPEIRLSIVIHAPRERVFRALIEPDALNSWVAAAADVDARVGGHYRYGWTYKIKDRDVVGGPTTILDLVPNERLVTDWLDWRGDATRPPTRLAWLLDDVPGGTRVTLVHGGFSRVADQSDYPFGWVYFIEKLKATVEGIA